MSRRPLLRYWIVLLLAVGGLLAPFASPARSRNHPSKRSVLQSSQTETGQSSTLLPDGRWLLLGGQGPQGPVTTAAMKDPETGVITVLPTGLLYARTGQSATLLPNGTVLIFGGADGTGHLVDIAEVFDPSSLKFSVVPSTGLTSRAYHSANLLTDGTLLVAGGLSATGDALGLIEIWDFRTNSANKIPQGMLIPRSRQVSKLLADGTVSLWGGLDNNGVTLTYGEVFDPATQRTRIETSPPTEPSGQQPVLHASIPQDDASNVSLTPLIALRFSVPLNVTSLNGQTVTLSSSQGAVEAKVVPAQGGIVCFITPQSPLAAGTTFSISVDGAKDWHGTALPGTAISFTTAHATAQAPTTSDDMWVPNVQNFEGSWKSGQGQSPLQALPPLQAAPDVTALAGQTLRLNGSALPGVTLQIDGQITTTDQTGRFLLTGLTAGHQVLLVDGTTASKPGRTYGIFEIGVDLIAGQTTALKFTIWMTRLDMAHAATIPSPTSTETIISTPLLPGLELHLAPNTVIRDHTGKVVTKISITPVPIDQPPFPLPTGVSVPIYFTIQPGDAYIETQAGSWVKGARLFYPNSHDAKPGTPFDFWNYDAPQKGWYVYGLGTVSTDGKQIVPNPGVEIYEFTGAMVGSPSAAKGIGPTAYPPPRGGEPVDLSTGLFIYEKTDLVLPDVIPLSLERTYTTNDGLSRSFGVGAMSNYDIFMVGDSDFYTFQELCLPDGGRIHFYRTSPGAGYGNAVYASTSTQSKWYGATITFNNAIPTIPLANWVLTTRDGTSYYFPDGFNQTNPAWMALLGIKDRYGNTVTITRDTNRNITSIASPNGRAITFQHDTSNRITQAQDSSGRRVTYTYDSGGRLWTVTDANAGVTTLTYDSNNNMLTVKDPRGIVYLTNQYDGNGRVSQQTLGDSGIYKFAWTPTATTVLSYSQSGGSGGLPPGGSASAVAQFRTCTSCFESFLPLVTEAQVTDPRGVVRDVKFSSTGQLSSDTYALGKPEQETFTYAYYADNLIQTVTDQLGRVTAFQYDSNGNITQITRLSGTSNAVSSSFSYDSNFSQLTSVSDPLNNTTSISVDNYGNPQTITDPLTHQTALTFNSAGQPLTVKDAQNDQTQLAYLAGDLASITDPLNRTTNRFTDGLGRIVAVIDPAGEVTKLAYNPLNQVLTATNPVGGATNFTYDGNGNLLTVKDANNHTTTFTYENMDRVATRKDALNRSESYQYDVNGNLTQFTDRRGKVTTYTYDNLNRRTFAGFGTQAGPTYESTINYTWDAGNRLTKIVDSVTGTIIRGYDGLDRLTSEQTPQGTVSYTYDAASRRQTMTVAGQTAVNYTFDNATRLTKIAQGTTTVQLAYDNANRRASVTLPNGIIVSYGFDNASELTGLTYSLNSNTLGNLTYSYDMAGRRTTIGGTYARTGLPNAQSTTAYDAANELTMWGSATPTYDSNGNVLSDGTNSYVWNARNQLASMNMSAQSFRYDPLGRRVAKTILTTTTSYLYDAVNPVQELSGTTPTANLMTGGVDEYFQRTDSAGPANFLSDALGSTLALTNSSGSDLGQYTYDPFGNTSVSGSSASTYQYAGRENDGTGVYFYRARYYNQATQRFVSEDPIEFEDGTNKYQYVANSPPNFTDPRGLQTTQTGVGGTFTASPVAGTGGAGVATDEFGDVGLYVYGGGGAGFGAGFSGGLQGSLSNGNTINDLNGWFYNTSIGGGDGIGGSYDGFSGASPSGNQLAGLGGTVGPAAGFSGFAGRTYTWVFPLFNWIQWLAGRQCPNGAPGFMYQPAGGGLYYTPEPGEPGFPWN
jgi:RHS repeat-associated protein